MARLKARFFIQILVFGRAIHCLSKIGDDLYLEASEDGVRKLSLKLLSLLLQAFVCISSSSKNCQ